MDLVSVKILLISLLLQGQPAIAIATHLSLSPNYTWSYQLRVFWIKALPLQCHTFDRAAVGTIFNVFGYGSLQ